MGSGKEEEASSKKACLHSNNLTYSRDFLLDGASVLADSMSF